MSYGNISQQNCKTICLYMFMAVINVSWWLMVVLHAFVWHGSPFGLSPGGLSAWPRGPGCLPPAACCGGVQLPLGRIQLHRHLTVLRPVLCGSLRSADWDLADRKRVWEGGAGLVVGFLPLDSWDFEVGWGWISLLMVKFMKSPNSPDVLWFSLDMFPRIGVPRTRLVSPLIAKNLKDFDHGLPKWWFPKIRFLIPSTFINRNLP